MQYFAATGKSPILALDDKMLEKDSAIHQMDRWTRTKTETNKVTCRSFPIGALNNF